MYQSDFIKSLFGLEGKVAVVTGAGSGIGWRIARFLSRAGAAVTVADWNGEAAKSVAKELTDDGGKAIAVTVDVSKEDQVKALFSRTTAELGTPWILVNCAAIFPMEKLSGMPTSSWDQVHDVDLKGVFLCLREAAMLMQAAGKGGRIINISSLDAQNPAFIGLAHYSAAKAGVHGLTYGAALEFAPDQITVNAIMPGNTLTEGGMKTKPLLPMEKVIALTEQRNILGRMGAPEDIAGAVLYLASPAAAYVTGATLMVDGGRHLA